MAEGWIVKAAALVAAALALGGCNLVVSATPVFSAADAAGAPTLRPGVWAAPQPNCDFKPADPLAAWPQCAGGGVITETAFLAAVDPSGLASSGQPPAPDAPKQPRKVPYVLAAGDPRVLQVGVELPLDPAAKTRLFFFAALRPTAHDADGRITGAEIWFVQCGPPPPPKPTATGGGTDTGGITDHPLPGMTVDKDTTCTPSDKAAVRNAAVASRAWADQVGALRWVRDGEK
jgi:hypothetical protein